DVGPAIRGISARRVLVRRDRREARNDHEADESDNDELVAPGHLAGGRLPRAPERNGNEEKDQDDRQPEESSLEPSAAAVRGRLTAGRGGESRARGLEQDGGRAREGNGDPTDLEGVHA